MKTVKRLTAAIVCVVMVLAFVPSDALAYDSSFSVQKSKSNVDIGEVFTVTVKLDSDKSRVGGLDFRLTYDSAKLEVTETSIGSTGAVLDETLSRPSSGTVMYTASAADYRNGDSLAAGALISVGFRVKSAASLELGSVWVHREREIFDSENGKALLREWGLDETLRGVGSIALGYPASEPGEPAKRKDNYVVIV